MSETRGYAINERTNSVNQLCRRCPGTARRALSLLEVVLALAILAVSLAILGNLFDLSLQSAVDARDLTRAQLLCESTMAAITAGALPTSGGTALPIESEPDWFYSVVVEPTELESLQAVTVTVHRGGDGAAPWIRFAMTQWLIEPEVEEAARQEGKQLFESQQEQLAEENAEGEG